MKFVWFVCYFLTPFYKIVSPESKFWNILNLFYSQFTLFWLFVSQEPSKPRWERCTSKWDANKVTQPHKRLKMKREGDKGNERQGNLMGLWQPSCPIWKHLRFRGWGVVSSASGSGPQMDYSKSNHNTWIWDASCQGMQLAFCHILCLSIIIICLSSL